MTSPNLFGVEAKERKAKAAPVPAAEVQRLIGAWARLFEGRFQEKPIIVDKDGAAVKRLLRHAPTDVVERRLRSYLSLDDPYLLSQGYPLHLMLGAWNRLVALEKSEAPSRVPDAASTDRYLRDMRSRR